jgi:hypothetical protein
MLEARDEESVRVGKLISLSFPKPCWLLKTYELLWKIPSIRIAR